jgi:hypothetical protein
MIACRSAVLAKLPFFIATSLAAHYFQQLRRITRVYPDQFQRPYAMKTIPPTKKLHRHGTFL